MKYNILYVDYVKRVQKGGGQEYLVNLLKNLDRNRFNPICVSLSKEFPIREWQEIGVKIESVKVSEKMFTSARINPWRVFTKLFFVPFWFVLFTRELKGLIERNKIHLVHANGEMPFILSFLITKILGIPIIFHIHNMMELRLDRVLSFVSGKLFADKVFVVSKAAVRKFIKEIGANKKVLVVYNGVDLNKFDSLIDENRVKKIREELGVEKDERIVVSVGSLLKSKGHRYFLKAASKVLSLFPKTKFVLVGEGPCRGELEDFVKEENLSNNVIFTGFRDDIPEIMATMDILVNPSIMAESFGMAITEAMAMKKPVIATDIGGPSEIIQNGICGILVPPKDLDALAKAISSLLDDGKRREGMGVRAHDRVNRFFDIKGNVKVVQEVYMSLLTRNQS